MLAPLSIYSVWHFPFLLNRKRKKEVEIKTTGLLFFFRTTRTFHFHLLLLQLKKKIQRKNKKKKRSPVTLATINNGMDYVPAWIELAQHFGAPSELLCCCRAAVRTECVAPRKKSSVKLLPINCEILSRISAFQMKFY